MNNCIAAVGLLLLASAASAVQVEGQQQPSAGFKNRRALRLVVDTDVTEHWGHGQATATATWVPAKAAHDKKEAEKAPATDDTPKQIKETVYLKPVDECDEECIKKFIPDFSKKFEDSAAKTVSINKEAVINASKQGITVSTKSGP